MSRTLMPISSSGLREAVDCGELRCVRIGHRVLIDRDELADYLEQGQVTESEGAR